MRGLRCFSFGTLIALGTILIAGQSLLRAQDRASEPRPDAGQGIGLPGGMRGAAGKVTAIHGSELTIRSDEDGESYRVETGPNTRFRKDREPAGLSDVHVGDVVFAAGALDEKEKSIGAVMVSLIDAQQYAKMRADFGKTWTTGKVQAVSVDDLTITVLRPDNVTQTVLVDENTSFRSRSESITLADIKIGERVTARGALKDGKFVAATLMVGRGVRGAREQGNAPATGGSQPQ